MAYESRPLFAVAASVEVAAAPETVFAVISDLGRSAEWSPECLGGQWVSGAPGTVGSVFRGENLRADDVVGWAPVVRGRWFTEAEVVAARPGEHFAWAMRDTTGRRQDSVWSFSLEPTERGCLLTHTFVMGEPTEGIRHITAGMDAATAERFRVEWTRKLAADLDATVNRLKHLLERADAPTGAGTA